LPSFLSLISSGHLYWSGSLYSLSLPSLNAWWQKVQRVLASSVHPPHISISLLFKIFTVILGQEWYQTKGRVRSFFITTQHFGLLKLSRLSLTPFAHSERREILMFEGWTEEAETLCTFCHQTFKDGRGGRIRTQVFDNQNSKFFLSLKRNTNFLIHKMQYIVL